MNEYVARLTATRAIIQLLIQDSFFQTSVSIEALCKAADVDFEDVEDLLPRRKAPRIAL